MLRARNRSRFHFDHLESRLAMSGLYGPPAGDPAALFGTTEIGHNASGGIDALTVRELSLSPPEREANWASRLYQRSSVGDKPYVEWGINPDGGGGYWLDGDDHYDPLWVFYQAQDYARANDLAVTDYSAQIEAAVTRWRDYAVLAKYPEGLAGGETPGVQGYHAILSGIARHYAESGYTDQDDVRAADILLSSEWWTEARIAVNEAYYHLGTVRENAFHLMMAIDRDAVMKLGVHPAVDSFARIALRHLSDLSEPAETRRYGTAFKPFMVGLATRGLIMYWDRFQGDASRADIVGRIPAAIKEMTRYMWENTWLPEEQAITYTDIGPDHPLMVPITGNGITGVLNARNRIRGPETLSDRDDYYTGSLIAFDGVNDLFLIEKYVGATREITISPFYTPGWELEVGDGFTIRSSANKEGDGPGAVNDLNHMVAPGYAWAYWHEKVVLGNADASMEYRDQFHRMFNGAAQAWQDPWGQKQYNQSLFWVTDGLKWARTADAFTGVVVVSNRPPVANADAATTAATTPVRIAVLANDGDPDGDPLTVISTTAPARGTVAINADGTVTYTPSAGFVGTDTFSYTISDGRGGTATSTVTVTVCQAWAVHLVEGFDFGGPSPGPGWGTTAGLWVQRDGVLSQSATRRGDTQKAMVVDRAYPADVEVSARVRVDSWAGGDWARAGVSLAQADNGLGYNLLFRDGGVRFLDDHVAWSPLFPFAWRVGAWYRFKLRSEGGVLHGKVWADGADEPSAWMFTQAGWADRVGGFAGLNGGAGTSTASFDDFTVAMIDGAAAVPSATTGLAATPVSPGQVDLSWSAASGADGYTIERSPDGTTSWTQVGTTPSGTTDFQDTGLDASTAYFYRVTATNAAGASAPGDVAGATTPAAAWAVHLVEGFDFGGPSPGPGWGTTAGLWVQRDGVLSQSATRRGDTQKAMVVDRAYPADVEVSARVRVDSWAGGDWARAGVSLAQADNGLGYNLLFRDGGVRFLDDHVAWSPLFPFAWRVGAWYRFKLRSEGGVLHGKVWADGADEPSAWMFTQAGWADRVGGFAGLNGGAGTSTASFDDFTVAMIDGARAVPSATTGLAATPVSPGQVDLSWSAASGADGYTIERSPDGTTSWTQVGTTPSGTTDFQDTGLDASTAYFYRVTATNAAGASAPGDVAGATTPAAAWAVHLVEGFDFGGPSPGPGWGTTAGLWVQRDGVLSQSATRRGDTQKAMVVDRAYPADVEVSARVRVDSWAGGDWARAGVSLAQADNGLGYNLLFRDGGVRFLDDHVAWSPLFPFAWRVGAWYRFKLRSEGGVLHGKVWADGADEPSAWMFTQAGWADRVGGFAGLNGGAGTSTASFNDFTVAMIDATSPA